MNTVSKCLSTVKFFAESVCLLLLLPAFGFRLMLKPGRQAQAMGSALFVMGSILWLMGLIAISCRT